MKTLVVQKRLPFAPKNLNKQSASFIRAVRKAIREAKQLHHDDELELSDIGFIPANEFVEIKIYFRFPAEAETL